MPYAANSELPPAVRSRYSDRCQSVFRKAFNAHTGDEASRFKVAHTAANNCMNATGKADMEPDELDAWFDGKIGRPLRTLPFGGLFVGPDGKARDLEGDYFSDRTDIKPHWFSERPVLWHHGADPTGLMGDRVLGKAINLHQEEDGWWEDLWLNAGEARLKRVRGILAKGGQLFGSSTPLQTPGFPVKRAKDGEILTWAHAESTLSTSPVNHLASFRPAKATLDDFTLAEIPVSALTGFLTDLDALGADLSVTSSVGIPTAKAGRVLSATNETQLRSALAALSEVLHQLDPAPTHQALAKEIEHELNRPGSGGGTD